jgi:hypothetical protein
MFLLLLKVFLKDTNEAWSAKGGILQGSRKGYEQFRIFMETGKSQLYLKESRPSWSFMLFIR